MRTGNRRSASIIISFELAAIRFHFCSLDESTVASLCPVAWARDPVALCSHHVWPRPSLLRCERDQARLLDPTTSADPEHRAQLERRANRSTAGGPLRRQGRRAQPGCDALGPRAFLEIGRA